MQSDLNHTKQTCSIHTRTEPSQSVEGAGSVLPIYFTDPDGMAPVPLAVQNFQSTGSTASIGFGFSSSKPSFTGFNVTTFGENNEVLESKNVSTLKGVSIDMNTGAVSTGGGGSNASSSGVASSGGSSAGDVSAGGGGCPPDCNTIEKILNSIFSYTVDTDQIEPLIVDEVILKKGHTNASDEISSKILEFTRGAAIGASTWKLNKFFSGLSGGASTFLPEIDINYTINYEVVKRTMWEGNYTYNILTNKILNINTKNTYTVIFNRVTSISDGIKTMTLKAEKVDPNLKKLLE